MTKVILADQQNELGQSSFERYKTEWSDVNQHVIRRGTIVSPLQALKASNEATALHEFSSKNRLIDDKQPFFMDDEEYRFLRIRWDSSQDKVHDAGTVALVRRRSGLDISTVVSTARKLSEATGNDSNDLITVLKSSPWSFLKMHKDNQKSVDSTGETHPADDTFTRDILQLRGKRKLAFARSRNDVPIREQLPPGEAYTLYPDMVFHSVGYSFRCLALYLQS